MHFKLNRVWIDNFQVNHFIQHGGVHGGYWRAQSVLCWQDRLS